MKFVRWDDLEKDVRLRVLAAAGITPAVTKELWDSFGPHAKVRIADAVAELSGGAAAFEDDSDMLEIRRWNTMTDAERREEYAAED